VEPALNKKHLGFISALVALALTLLTAAGVWFSVKAQAQDAFTMARENAVETRQIDKRVQTLEDTVLPALEHLDKHLEKIEARLERGR
jgi:hypothetical protein